MAEYISREKAILALLEKGQHSKRYKTGKTWELNFDEIREAINEVPAADVVDRKHGKWQIVEKHTEYRTERCSVCGFAANRTYIRDIWNFCPNCGADNRESEDE